MSVLTSPARLLPVLAALAAVSIPAAAIELTTNGNFETGDLTGWTSFVNAPATFAITGDSSTGSFAGVITNTVIPSGQVVKQANIGVGLVMPGDALTVTFDAKGTFEGVGGVAFAEFFSELSGGGTSKAEILTGAPLALSTQYQTFVFNVTAGPDVSGGVTLQFNSATGGAGINSTLFIDNVSVDLVPEPASIGVLALAGLGLLKRRR